MGPKKNKSSTSQKSRKVEKEDGENREFEKQYKCKFCDHRCNDKSNLRHHIKKKHKMENAEYKCEFCDYTSNYKPHLNRHVKGKHVKEMPAHGNGTHLDYTTKELSDLQ